MPLISGKSDLKAALLEMYLDTKSEKSAAFFAKKRTEAIYAFVHTGIPMTIIATFPGPVVGAMTGGPVQGMGIGGLDKPAPGMGLEAAKSLLVQELIGIWTHGNAVHTPEEMAEKEATAIFNYYSQAIVMTQDKTDAPLPAPPPVGPVTGPIKGKGGVNAAPSPGSGYDSVKPTLQSELERIYAQVKAERSVAQFADEIATAIHAFCKEGKVDTQGTFLAPASVAPPPAPPMGAYMPGVGASITAKVS